MKNPREILLARHRATDLKLDVIRREVVATELNNQATKEPGYAPGLVALLLRCPTILWRELIVPSRRIWAGLAAVWLMILAVNLAQRDHSSSVKTSVTPMAMSIEDQQRWLNELFADRSPAADTDRPKPISPGPRTEITEFPAV